MRQVTPAMTAMDGRLVPAVSVIKDSPAFSAFPAVFPVSPQKDLPIAPRAGGSKFRAPTEAEKQRVQPAPMTRNVMGGREPRLRADDEEKCRHVQIHPVVAISDELPKSPMNRVPKSNNTGPKARGRKEITGADPFRHAGGTER